MATNSNCPAGAPYESLRYCQGTKIIPGVRDHVYAIAKRDIVTWPTLPAVATESVDLAKLATYSGAFVLASDKKWQRIDLSLNKGNIECETQGDRPSRTFLNKITLSYPGCTAQAVGFCRMAVDDDMVFLVPQRDGKYRVLGNEMFQTDVKPKVTTGEGTTTAGGTEIAVEVTDICPAPFYGGVIETADRGNVSGADDTVQPG